jgi:hypothetical protein
MAGELSTPAAVEIRIANVDLVPKLSAICAALEAVRLAHRDDMSPRCWAEINQAEEHLAAAMVHRSHSRLAEGGR